MANASTGRVSVIVLLAAGAIGYLLVGLVWLTWGAQQQAYWRNGNPEVIAEATSGSGSRHARLVARSRTRIGVLGSSGQTEHVLLLSVDDGTARSETWAITRLGSVDPSTRPRLSLQWSGDRRVAVVGPGVPQLTFDLAVDKR